MVRSSDVYFADNGKLFECSKCQSWVISKFYTWQERGYILDGVVFSIYKHDLNRIECYITDPHDGLFNHKLYFPTDSVELSNEDIACIHKKIKMTLLVAN